MAVRLTSPGAFSKAQAADDPFCQDRPDDLTGSSNTGLFSASIHADSFSSRHRNKNGTATLKRQISRGDASQSLGRVHANAAAGWQWKPPSFARDCWMVSFLYSP